ncbi:DegT/DnrJ/EryC1/StrS family aminotransferase [Desulfovibrio sp. OttesenSCG-928-I05]|nr:DegT/DnrJ/EryC1/StrS family aminotransferase [Desulfovibrio sp. OttesenSCG-928-I05]
MQLIDLKAQQAKIRDTIECRIRTVLDHGTYIMGPEVRELEERLASHTGAKHCIGCSSGTEALLMALMAWGVGPGDAVFAPALTFFATAEVASLLGATPVMVDIKPDTYTLDPEQFEQAVAAVLTRDPSLHPLPGQAVTTQLTPKAVIPVNLYGQTADYDALLSIARRHEMFSLEDAAQSFGAHYKGKRSCALGCDIAATSFFPGKPLGCYGDGGAVFTDNDEYATLLRSIRIHGMGANKYDNVRIGLNARLDTMQAAVLLCKLDIFDKEFDARQKIATRYEESLAPLGARYGIRTPKISPAGQSAWAQYCVRIPGGKRDTVAGKLKEQGIPTNIYYPTPLHMLGAFSAMGYKPHDVPNALEASQQVLALPFHPYLKEEDMARIVTALEDALND